MINLNNLRRDFLTASIIVAASAVVAAPAMLFRSGGARPAPPPTGAALLIGTHNKDAPLAKDLFDPATRNEADKAKPKPQADPMPEVEAETKPAKPVQVAATDESAGKPLKGAKGEGAPTVPLTPKEPTPAPNAVEQAPRLIEEMAKEEIRATLDRYQRWRHEGKIQLRLSIDRLPRDEIAKFAGCFVLSSSSRKIRVSPEGEGTPMNDSSAVANRLGGELDRKAWPGSLDRAAEHWFGPANHATAFVILSDESQLLVYRALASGLGDRKLQEEAEYRLGLRVDPDTHRLVVEFLPHR
jgi:hypothetical protein